MDTNRRYGETGQSEAVQIEADRKWHNVAPARQTRLKGIVYVINGTVTRVRYDRTSRADAARGHYDKTPAAKWRLLDLAHDPSLRELIGTTAMQDRLESCGWDNQGNGATMAALVKRGLVVHGQSKPRGSG